MMFSLHVLVFLVSVPCTTSEHAVHCPHESCADAQVLDATSIEVNLLQTDVLIERRGRTPHKPFQVQAGGIVDATALETVALLASRRKKSVEETTTTFADLTSGAAASGVKTNAAGDLMAFVSSLFTNVAMIAWCTGWFMILKERYPLTYKNSVKLNSAPLNWIPPGMWGWVKASWDATTEDVIENCGLDQAMLLRFTELAMRIMAIICVPMFFLMGPINCIFGGHRAGPDHLSYFSFGNVVNGSPLYWIHALLVWFVVFTVTSNVHKTQAEFLQYRYTWLRRLPQPRSNTVLVEGIPDTEQSEDKLFQFFAAMFGANKIKSTYMVKVYPELEAAYDKSLVLQNKLDQAKNSQLPTAQDESAKLQLERDITDTADTIQNLQSEVKKSMEQGPPFKYVSSSGFVSFTDHKDVEFALSVQISDHADLWNVSMPPPPNNVLWQDLQQTSTQKDALTLLGYSMTAGLFMAYTPSVIGITEIAEKIDMGPLQPMWAAFAPTMGLLFMVSFLPTFLVLIFKMCFTLKDEGFSQQILQNWYFVFQMVFVILITAIGSSLPEFLDTLVEHPTDIVVLLGDKMPPATHFYMNYLVLQWASHSLVLTRYMPFGKFLVFRRTHDDETARAMSEPEDQDYYGIGSRSCRFTTNLCIGIVYGTLSPPITVLTFVEFLVCRIIYGYLIPFAESKKEDLGGVFWVQQLRHTFTGCIIYCLMMTGVLLGRASTNGPGVIAASSLGLVIFSARKFERVFSWEKLPFKEVMLGQEVGHGKKRRDDIDEYIQPFMKEQAQA